MDETRLNGRSYKKKSMCLAEVIVRQKSSWISQNRIYGESAINEMTFQSKGVLSNGFPRKDVRWKVVPHPKRIFRRVVAVNSSPLPSRTSWLKNLAAVSWYFHSLYLLHHKMRTLKPFLWIHFLYFSFENNWWRRYDAIVQHRGYNIKKCYAPASSGLLIVSLKIHGDTL